MAIPSLYNPANYDRFSVCSLSPGVPYPPVYGISNWNTLFKKGSVFLSHYVCHFHHCCHRCFKLTVIFFLPPLSLLPLPSCSLWPSCCCCRHAAAATAAAALSPSCCRQAATAFAKLPATAKLPLPLPLLCCRCRCRRLL